MSKERKVLKMVKLVIIFVESCLILVGLGSYVFAQETFTYDSKGKRDPFIPLVGKGRGPLYTKVAVDSEEGIYLEGIVWDPGGVSVAIINGEIVTEGGLVGDFKVKKIRREGVILVKDGEEHVVNLIKEE